MKNIKFKHSKLAFLLGLVFTIVLSCDRELSDEAVFAKFPNTGEIFTDAPVGLTDQFFVSFDPATGANTEGFDVDNNVAFEGNSSIVIDVPSGTDPNGVYIGGIFRDRGEGRDLTGYDALTFWAQGSTTAIVEQVGFGTTFGDNFPVGFVGDNYATTIKNIELSTKWRKYIIPIPDASKLVQETGLFLFSANSNVNGGVGYRFWIDELKFEKLGNIAQPRPAMLGGENVNETTFIGTTINLSDRGLTQTYNLGSGLNQTATVAAKYFTFESSNTDVATVNELGIVTVRDSGMATITASIAGVKAEGSLIIESIGNFNGAPTPTRDPANVISVFSDAYTNVPVDYFNGFFLDGFQTTQGGSPPLTLGNGQVINYTELNFVAIGTFFDVAPLNLTEMTHIHVDINVQEAIDSGDYINLELLNSVGNNETSGSVRINSNELVSNQWVGIDIPLDDFGLASRNAIGLLFFISDGTISNIFVDNVYYYRE